MGIDAKNGLVAIEGWESTSPYTAVEFARHMEKMGVETIIYTDIAKDGMLIGPSLKPWMRCSDLFRCRSSLQAA